MIILLFNRQMRMWKVSAGLPLSVLVEETTTADEESDHNKQKHEGENSQGM